MRFTRAWRAALVWMGRAGLMALCLNAAADSAEPRRAVASITRADTPIQRASPDALIGKTLQDIRASRLDDALEAVDHLIALRPDFKLAHLIKGDLLMARARPLAGIGQVKPADPQSLSDLRDEARVRLLRYIDQPDPDSLPRQILQLAPHQRYALMADAARARLYLFENVDGEPRLLRDYYMAIGRNGTDKRVEGDKRTPVGVYHITRQLPANKLADLYGSGAFPLNYPNDWDQEMGRSGHGIWLHGMPSDTYSRPPRSSEGCVVVTNPDLNELRQWIEVGITPVIIADRADWVDRQTWTSSRDEILQGLQTWRENWQNRAADDFLEHYSRDFLRAAGAGWPNAKKRNILGKSWISLELKDISLFLYPGGDMAYTEFTQIYRSNALNSTVRKRLYWKRQDDAWKIALERSAPAPTQPIAKRPSGPKG